MKKEVEPIENAIESLSKLRGVAYRYRTDEFAERRLPEGRPIGFIAQELAEVFPQLVATDAKGYLGVDYSKLVAVLTEAVKQVAADKNRLREELAEVRTEQARLQALVDEMLERVAVTA